MDLSRNITGMYNEWNSDCIIRNDNLKKRSTLLSWLRLLNFIGIALALILAFVYGTIFFWLAGLLSAAFIALIAYHEKVSGDLKYTETYKRILENELSTIDYKFVFDPGNKYIDSTHPYSSDLDVFGENSLFQSLNRTSTPHGSAKLAELLMKGCSNTNIIKETQEAVDDLSKKPQWLLRFMTFGILGNNSGTSESELLSWIESKPQFTSLTFNVLIWLTPFLSAIVLTLVISGQITFGLFLLYLLFPLGLPAIFTRTITSGHMQVSRKAEMLDNYSKRLSMVEKEIFISARLNNIQKYIKHSYPASGIQTKADIKSASDAIRKLSKIISSMDARLNWLMWIILNFLLLWDIRQIRRLELWRVSHSKNVKYWFDGLADIEALGSLAGFRIINPKYTFPEPINEKLTIKATDAGHPLIPDFRRINNGVNINGSGAFNIITGANMAGKSTYLRTVGINLVLAHAGAPVCAAEFSFYPAFIHSSLHTVDSLSTNKSYFFAELERLKQIIDRLNAGTEIYVFLDEILKGTNSHDKQQGSKALLKQLITLGTAGMIATHDLDLGQLEQTFPDNISNYSFEAVIRGNELSFDYKLNKGIAQNMNATFLMKQMGITL